jgi:hypothetical protein
LLLIGPAAAVLLIALMEPALAQPTIKLSNSPFIRPSQSSLVTPASEPPQLLLTLVRRGPYGEVTGFDERRISSKDWGKPIKWEGLDVTASPLLQPNGSSPSLKLHVKTSGFALPEQARKQGALRYVVPMNGKLHTILGRSPGEVAELTAAFGEPQLGSKTSPPRRPARAL